MATEQSFGPTSLKDRVLDTYAAVLARGVSVATTLYVLFGPGERSFDALAKDTFQAMDADLGGGTENGQSEPLGSRRE